MKVGSPRLSCVIMNHMTLRQYLTIMTAAAVLAWGAVATVILSVHPSDASSAILAFLYLALFTALAATLAVVGFLVRAALLRASFDVARQVAVSFRQALLLSFAATLALLLSSRDWLNWWSATFIIIGLTGIELLVISAKIKRAN